ncbi:MAG: serine/threonine protein kinase [Deltaproteobacteria bacterium]|nr:serine/threonine protein kinase [Deltaproteobacteria bacterium]
MSSKKSLFSPGDMIAGRYEVLNALGQGAMGEVVRVADHALEKEVIALKILYPKRARVASNVARFRREVLLARKLTHHNVVQVFDFGEADKGCYYISMEYIEGTSLAKWLQAPPSEQPTFQEVLYVLYQICGALHFAHGKGVIHRDLKPDNVLIDIHNIVKLTDFGVARLINDTQHLTAAGKSVGTVYYMAPEQFTGQEIDHRVDIYALGIMAYELVTGQRPFEHENIDGLATMHLTQALPNFKNPRFDVPSWYRSFVQHCVEKHPDHRFKSMAEAADKLAEHGSSYGIPPTEGDEEAQPAKVKAPQKINLMTLWRSIFS